MATDSAADPHDVVALAVQGDEGAREQLVLMLQDAMYGLAVRMLGDPTEAEDATQEILIRILSNLGSFRGESAFTTWAFRVAANHLLTMRKSRGEAMGLSFEALDGMLEQGLTFPAEQAAEMDRELIEHEVKLGCTHSMLVCLDRPKRLAFILDEVLELDSAEAAYALGISAPAFRKRASRARAELRAFMTRRCGLVNPDAACRCARQAPFAVAAGLVNPAHLRFATHTTCFAPPAAAEAATRRLEQLEAAAAVFRSHPRYAAPSRLAAAVKDWLAAGAFGPVDVEPIKPA